jgi:cell division protein FtsW
MGEPTFVMSNPMVKPKSASHSLRLGSDVVLLASVISLVVFGLFMLYSSTWKLSFFEASNTSYYVLRQILWVILGSLVGFVVSRIDYRRLTPFALLMMIFTILVLLVLVIMNLISGEKNRGLFGTSVQPSELAQLALIIYLAVWLNSKQAVLQSITLGLLPMGIILGIVAGLLFSDISAAVIIITLGGLLFFLAKAVFRQIMLVIILSIFLSGFIYSVIPRANERVRTYLDSQSDPNKASDQLQSSFLAISRGGIFGVGIGKGITKVTILYGAYNDSIFSVIVEETGLVGGVFIIALYMVILWRGLRIAYYAIDLTGRLMAAGITCMILIQAFVNMGAMVNLLPVAGNTLPFISLGGSSMIISLTGIGILLSIARVSSKEPNSTEGRSFSAAVNLRWRDGRRRLSRPRRSGSAQ